MACSSRDGCSVPRTRWRGWCWPTCCPPISAPGTRSPNGWPGTKQIEAAPTDLAAAVDMLRARGVSRVGIAGASMGGTAALLTAADDPAGIPAVVAVSAPQVLGGLAVGPEVLQRVTGAKLY